MTPPKVSLPSCGEGVRSHQYPLTWRLTLRCHGRRARFSPRAMTIFPMMKLGLANPQWWIYISIIKRNIRSKTYSHLKRPTRMTSRTNQRLAGRQHEAQQPRVAATADVKQDTETLERMEGAEADDEKNEDISSAWVDYDPMHLVSFVDEESPNVQLSQCKDHGLVGDGAEPVEVNMSTPAGGLLIADTASTTL